MQEYSYLLKLSDMKSYLTTLILACLFFVSKTEAQDNCKVLLEEISGVYDGDCKKGLAHGDGIAKGKDIYEGEFKRGLPDGKGVYTYSNGKVFDGGWNNGLKEGEGKYIYKTSKGDSIVAGFWREDRYLGEKYVPPFKVVQESNVERYLIKKMPTNGNHRILLQVRDYSGNASAVTGFLFNVTSGIQSGSSDRTIIDNVDFPFEGSITYTATSKISGQPINVVFNFVLNDPSSYMITIKNQ